ncbi:MAG: pyridoxamine 5'-phosphate oxidase family protein [Candidatus Nomurabacteria bacterium]|nr:MAG: pyridoxamine 5'-phosphate oxidase family protein [Candidatus Nomurabacteria bacterium]
MNEIDWNQKLKEALDRTEFMAISTIFEGETWTNPVAFAYDEKINLYFISKMASRHSENILKNPKVSVAVYKTERFVSGDVLGLQIKGEAKHLTDKEEIKAAAAYYFERGHGNDEFRNKTAERAGAEAPWQFFKVTPIEVWCFDSREFGSERKLTPLDIIELG